jgi:hypothetical protein
MCLFIVRRACPDLSGTFTFYPINPLRGIGCVYFSFSIDIYSLWEITRDKLCISTTPDSR